MNLAGRGLNDEGLFELVAGLRDALQSTPPGHEIMLLELNLSNTKISTTSLSVLSTIIDLSANRLKDMDLSDNLIAIDTKEDERAWEIFLQSFRRCTVMKRLVLSQNDLSNPVAFEIFARVYSQHPRIEENMLLGAPSVGDEDEVTSSLFSMAKSGPKALVSTTEVGSKKACGLRSIPYIIIQEVNMIHLGALWLSFVLEVHHKPDSLMAPLKFGPIAAIIQEYNRSACEGIVYKPNTKLFANGWKLLDASEISRRQRGTMDQSLHLTSSGSDVSR